MSVEDWSTTAGANTTIGGIDIAENCSPGNLNNSQREMMAQIATWAANIADGSSKQDVSAILTSLAGLTITANKGLIGSGTDTLSTFDFTSIGRVLVGKATTAEMRTYLGIGEAPTISGTASSGYLTIPLGSGGPIKFQWKDATFAANGATTVTFPTAFASWSRAWNNGARQATNAQDNDPAVVSSGTASCSVYSASDSAISGTIFAIGV